MQFEQLGPYRLARRLGRGGMGTVFEGLNVETGQPAAIKVLNPHLAVEEGFRERFEIEIDSLKKLKHPNIVRLYGFGQQDGHLYYAMELVPGTNVEDELQAGRRFDWRETTRMAIKLARALKHAHDHGIIHRDLKPANLLLAGDGDLKLADFGIARLFGNTRLTSVGGLVGTAEYMAPEQADGRGVTPQSDLYSLGGVMFAMLAGRPPFAGGSLPEILQLHRFAEPPPVSRFAADVPRELQELITRLLSKEPAARGTNALVIAKQLSALEHALAAAPRARGQDRGQGAETGPQAEESEWPGPTQVEPAGLPGADDDHSIDTAATRDDVRQDRGQELGVTRDLNTLPATANLGPPTAAASFDSPSYSTQPESTSLLPNAAAPIAAPQRTSPLNPGATSDLSTLGGQVASSVLSADAAALPTAMPESIARVNRFVTVEEDERRRAAEEQLASHRVAWLQIGALALALAGIVAVGFYLTRPPSADQLAARIEAVAAGPADHLSDAEDDLGRFLARFPDDPRAAKLKEYQEEIDLQRLERRLQRDSRQPALGSSVSPIQRDYFEAIGLAATDPYQSAAKLQAILDVYGAAPNRSERTNQFLELTRRHLKQLHEQNRQQEADRLATIDASLARADEIAITDPAKARAIWSGIIALYCEKPWAAERVSQARAALKNVDGSR